jgi:hypothetical protein
VFTFRASSGLGSAGALNFGKENPFPTQVTTEGRERTPYLRPRARAHGRRQVPAALRAFIDMIRGAKPRA